jgi:hypothetical protein
MYNMSANYCHSAILYLYMKTVVQHIFHGLLFWSVEDFLGYIIIISL